MLVRYRLNTTMKFKGQRKINICGFEYKKNIADSRREGGGGPSTQKKTCIRACLCRCKFEMEEWKRGAPFITGDQVSKWCTRIRKPEILEKMPLFVLSPTWSHRDAKSGDACWSHKLTPTRRQNPWRSDTLRPWAPRLGGGLTFSISMFNIGMARVRKWAYSIQYSSHFFKHHLKARGPPRRGAQGTCPICL